MPIPPSEFPGDTKPVVVLSDPVLNYALKSIVDPYARYRRWWFVVRCATAAVAMGMAGITLGCFARNDRVLATSIGFTCIFSLVYAITSTFSAPRNSVGLNLMANLILWFVSACFACALGCGLVAMMYEMEMPGRMLSVLFLLFAYLFARISRTRFEERTPPDTFP